MGRFPAPGIAEVLNSGFDPAASAATTSPHVGARRAPIAIADRTLGDQAPVFVIAEIGNTHEGSIGQAQALIAAAAEAGADAVKLQTHLAEAETTPDAPFPPYFRPSETRHAYYERIAFDRAQYRDLSQFAASVGVVLLSSPFSIGAVELLESIGAPAYKIPSGEVTNLPYLDHVARLKKPVLLSSGMSSWQELDQAVETIARHHDRIVLLQCTSLYPCPPERVGLNILGEMRTRYGLPAGLSDHTVTIFASLAAVVLGACVIERHFTLSRKMYGPDPAFSLEPHDFLQLVEGIRAIEASLRHPVDKDDLSDVGEMKAIFQKSIVTARDLPAGTILTSEDLTTKKPGTGCPPRRLPEMIGRRTACFLPKDTMLSETHLI
jgi:N-acetylneuraminate synthase